MRRITTSLGAIAAGALLALALPAAAANAAEGVLVINGMPQVNPQGCISAYELPMQLELPMQMTNMTNHDVVVYAMPDCQGQITHILRPGMSRVVFGASAEVVDQI